MHCVGVQSAPEALVDFLILFLDSLDFKLFFCQFFWLIDILRIFLIFIDSTIGLFRSNIRCDVLVQSFRHLDIIFTPLVLDVSRLNVLSRRIFVRHVN